MTAVSKPLLRGMDARDGHRCVWHWEGACDPETLAPHHRANRGMGGRKSLDRLSNLVWLCSEANGAVESDADWADAARKRGIKISSNADPRMVPVIYPDGVERWLTDDGRAVETRQEVTF